MDCSNCKVYKELKVYEFKYKLGKPDPKSKVLKEHYKYNDKGLLIEEKQYDILENRFIYYEYNDKDLVREKEQYDSEDKYKRVRRYEYKYNVKGLMTDEITYDAKNELFLREMCEYNDKDLMIKKTIYLHGVKLVCTFTYEYNNKNLMIKQTEYDKFKGNLESTEDDKSKGKLESTEDDESEDMIESIEVYEYNDKDLMIKKTRYVTRNDRKWKYMYRYDKNLKIATIEKYNAQDEPQTKLVYEYE